MGLSKIYLTVRLLEANKETWHASLTMREGGDYVFLDKRHSPAFIESQRSPSLNMNENTTSLLRTQYQQKALALNRQ
jgi:hypothetical protein